MKILFSETDFLFMNQMINWEINSGYYQKRELRCSYINHLTYNNN
jgi:hypothetical protein